MVHFGEGSVTCATKGEETMRFGIFFPLLSEKFSLAKFDVMLYIGLRDKYGTKIYDGDILMNNTGDIFKVKWEMRNAAFRYVVIKGKQYSKTGDHEANSVVAGSYEVEIVGNIHENPELLEVA